MLTGFYTCAVARIAGVAGESLAISGWAGPPLGTVDMRVAATQALVAALRIVPEQVQPRTLARLRLPSSVSGPCPVRACNATCQMDRTSHFGAVPLLAVGKGW